MRLYASSFTFTLFRATLTYPDAPEPHLIQ